MNNIQKNLVMKLLKHRNKSEKKVAMYYAILAASVAETPLKTSNKKIVTFILEIKKTLDIYRENKIVKFVSPKGAKQGYSVSDAKCLTKKFEFWSISNEVIFQSNFGS